MGDFQGFSFGVIESDFADAYGHRNLELVVPLKGGGLGHFFVSQNGDWSYGATLGNASYSTASLIQSTFKSDVLAHGNLEVIARTGGELHHYYRVNNDWTGPKPVQVWNDGVASDVVVGATPSLVQAMPTNHAQHGNFELAAADVGGPIVHYFRDNTKYPYRWYRTDGDLAVGGASLLIDRADHRLEVLTLGPPFQSFIRDDAGWKAQKLVTEEGEVVPTSGLSVAACRSVYTGAKRVGRGGKNLELVAIRANATEAEHYWCDNSNSDLPRWHSGGTVPLVPKNAAASALVARTGGDHDADLSFFALDSHGAMSQWDRVPAHQKWLENGVVPHL